MGTMVVGAIAAVLAGVVLLIYVGQYRDSVRKEQKPVAVLVAKTLIPQGTTGDIVGSQQLYSITEIPANRVENGAITDPNSLKGKVVVSDLFPGKQLTESDFADSATTDFVNRLKIYDRAIAIPLDGAHGMIGYVQKGDHVDVMAGFNLEGLNGKQVPVVKTIMQDILVLDAPDSGHKGGLGSTNSTSNVVLLMDDQQAAQMAFASDYGKVWLVLRATTGGLSHPAQVVTAGTLLFGIPPIAVSNAFKRAAVNGGN